MNSKEIWKNFIQLPDGHSKHDDTDSDVGNRYKDSSITLQLQSAEQTNNCAIANLANCIFQFGDVRLFHRLVQVINSNKHCSFDDLIGIVCRKEYKYFTTKIISPYTISIYELNDMTQQFPALCKISPFHVVAIWKGRIYDHATTHALYLSKHALDWCCGDNEQFISFSRIALLNLLPKIVNKFNRQKKEAANKYSK